MSATIGQKVAQKRKSSLVDAGLPLETLVEASASIGTGINMGTGTAKSHKKPAYDMESLMAASSSLPARPPNSGSLGRPTNTSAWVNHPVMGRGRGQSEWLEGREV